MSVIDSEWETGYRQRRWGGWGRPLCCISRRNNPQGMQQAPLLPLNHNLFNTRTRGRPLTSLCRRLHFACDLNLKHRALKSHIKGFFDSSDRGKTWNKMTNYKSWLVGHVSYSLIGLHNVVQLLFSLHINRVSSIFFCFKGRAEGWDVCFHQEKREKRRKGGLYKCVDFPSRLWNWTWEINVLVCPVVWYLSEALCLKWICIIQPEARQ